MHRLFLEEEEPIGYDFIEMFERIHKTKNLALLSPTKEHIASWEKSERVYLEARKKYTGFGIWMHYMLSMHPEYFVNRFDVLKLTLEHPEWYSSLVK